MIYVGYQGIGKSTLARSIPNVIDLESSNFNINGKKIDNWEVIYCNIAKHLSSQGKIVFVSSHNEIRNYMKDHNIEYICIFPKKELKDHWINKLKDRYNRTQKDKDWKALNFAMKYYNDSIKELMEEKNTIIIDNIDYSLEDLIKIEK